MCVTLHQVNADLRIFGKENIFGAGDVNGVKEEKLAYRAQYHAKVIAQNIAALATNSQVSAAKWLPACESSVNWQVLNKHHCNVLLWHAFLLALSYTQDSASLHMSTLA